MHRVAASSLTSLPTRLTYTTSFLSFTPVDGAVIQFSGLLIRPIMGQILEGIYTKLLSYDITAQAFVPKTSHDDPNAPAPTSVEDLSLEHGHIGRQMDFLRTYLTRIVHNKDWTPESPLFEYLNQVAVMHTGAPGFKYRERKPEVRVEYMHMGLLLGHVEDMLIEAIMAMDIDMETKKAALRAWNKLLWLQNDLFARRYIVDRATGESPMGVTDSKL